MSDFIQKLKNIIDFNLRRKFNFSRRNYQIINEPKDAPQDREKTLLDKYNLFELRDNSTKQNYLENLYTIDLLDRYLKVESLDELSVLDVGCKNWFYAKAEYFFFNRFSKELKLKGIEIDANRLYSNFYSRGEVAKANIKGLENTTYISGDFLDYYEKYDYIVWILPFVIESPLIKWGLPISYFKPKEMLSHAYNYLKAGGKIFIINQGAEEYDVQKELYQELELSYVDIGIIESEFLSYKIPRYLTLVQK